MSAKARLLTSNDYLENVPLPPDRYHLEDARPAAALDFRDRVMVWLAWFALPVAGLGLLRRGARFALDAETYSVAGVVVGALVVLMLQRTKLPRAAGVVALLGPGMGSALVTASIEGGANSQTMIWLPLILFVAYAVGGVLAGRVVGVVGLVGFSGLVANSSPPTIGTHELLESWWSGTTALVGAMIVFELYERARAQGEQLVRESEAELRALVGTLPDIVLRVTPDGVVHREDGGARGAERDPEAPAPALPEALRLLAGDLDGVLQDGRPCDREVTCVGRPPATVYTVAIRRLGSDEALVVLRDVTSKRDLEQRFYASERLSALGRMASFVGHELNNPLAAVGLNLTYMHDALGERDSDLKAVTQESIGAIAKATSIVAQLHLLSSAQREERRVVSVASIVERAINLAGPLLKYGVSVETRVHGSNPRVKVDSGRIHQALVNLLLNAAQSIPQDRKEHLVSMEVFPRGDDVVIAVRDNGAGIPLELRDRIFEPFYTTRAVGMGAGLGLATARDVVMAHGGRLTVESELGVGSTFFVTLPRHLADGDVTVDAASLPWSQVALGAKVLVVDDETALAQALVRALAGTSVEVANSAAQALEMLHTTNFDVVLCDVMMPHMTGVELHERVRQFAPDVGARFVFMTGGVISDVARAYLDATGLSVLRKPLRSTEFARAVDRLAHASRVRA